MSSAICLVGDDFESDKKEYVTLKTTEGQRLIVALTASGIPFIGNFDEDSIFFSYDGDYKEFVDEIISKVTSEEYADERREILEHKESKDYMCFLSTVARIMGMTEGTLRNRPQDIQYVACRRYVENWFCDTYTIRRKIEDALTLKTKIE